MEVFSSLLFLPMYILIKAEIMKSITVKSPECRLDGYLRKFGNTSEITCVQCRECLRIFKEVSLCSKSIRTKCNKMCPLGSFGKPTLKKKTCLSCRKCIGGVLQIRCADIVDSSCALDSRHTKTDCICKACSVCREDEFTNANCSAAEITVCKPCKRCKPSHYVYQKCSSHANTQCKPCTKCRKGHTFIYKKCKGNKDTQCKQCSKCKPGHYVKKKCTTRHDTKCARCPRGNCNRCPFGTYKSFPDRSLSLCVPCDAGSFMDKDKHFFTVCKPCRRCGPHKMIAHACNITHDTRCGQCIPGFFRLPSSHNCALCSPCPPNATGLVVEECRQSTSTSRICRPSKPYDPRLVSVPKDDPLSPTTTAGGDLPWIDFKSDDEKLSELEFGTDFNHETDYPQFSDEANNDFIVILIVTVLISIFFIGFTLIIVTKCKTKSKNLKGKHNHEIKTETVSVPTLFSTNSITDCFDLGALYKISNPKYNSDPEFHKADFRNVSGSLCPAARKCSKSRSMGNVDEIEVEFWRDC